MSGTNLLPFVHAALMVLVLLFSVIVHEVAHGYVAALNGDPTARMLGRITLNPLPHIDPVGTILLPLLLYLAHLPVVGMAKPVPVNPLNFRNYRWGEFAVSAAGPLSNLALAVAFSVLLRLGFENPGVLALAQLGIQINILLALFNLIPIPPPGRLPHPGHPAAPGTRPALQLPPARGFHPHPHPVLHRHHGGHPHAPLPPTAPDLAGMTVHCLEIPGRKSLAPDGAAGA